MSRKYICNKVGTHEACYTCLHSEPHYDEDEKCHERVGECYNDQSEVVHDDVTCIPTNKKLYQQIQKKMEDKLKTNIGEIWRHKKNNKEYIIVDNNLHFKYQGEWVKGILYSPLEDNGHAKHYGRPVENFVFKFERV